MAPSNGAEAGGVGHVGREARRLRVLVAEDDEDVRRLVAAMLDAEGHDVIEVSNGAMLVDYLRQGPTERAARDEPDVIVTDIMMPGIDGIEALALLRSLDAETPLFIMTGVGDPQTHARARALGANAVFVKPFDLEDLKRAIAGVTPRQHPPR